MITFSICPSNMIGYVWPDIKHHMEAVEIVSNGDCSVDTIFDDLVAMRQYLVLVMNEDKIQAVCTLQLKTFDTGLRTIYFPVLAGTKINEWFDDLIVFIKQFAKQFGATELRGFMALKGWDGYLKAKDNWKDVHTVMSLQIGEE